MTYNKECKGCAEFEDGADSQNCHLAEANKYVNHCPCTLCLIKGMCNTPCDLYKKFDFEMRKNGMIYEK